MAASETAGAAREERWLIATGLQALAQGCVSLMIPLWAGGGRCHRWGSTVSTKLYSAAQGAPSKGPPTRQSLSRTIYGRPAWRQGAGCDDVWSALQGVVCSDSVSWASSRRASWLAGWVGEWVHRPTLKFSWMRQKRSSAKLRGCWHEGRVPFL